MVDKNIDKNGQKISAASQPAELSAQQNIEAAAKAAEEVVVTAEAVEAVTADETPSTVEFSEKQILEMIDIAITGKRTNITRLMLQYLQKAVTRKENGDCNANKALFDILKLIRTRKAGMYWSPIAQFLLEEHKLVIRVDWSKAKPRLDIIGWKKDKHYSLTETTFKEWKASKAAKVTDVEKLQKALTVLKGTKFEGALTELLKKAQKEASKETDEVASDFEVLEV